MLLFKTMYSTDPSFTDILTACLRNCCMCRYDNSRSRSEHQHRYIVSSLAISKYELYVSMSNIELCKLSEKFF